MGDERTVSAATFVSIMSEELGLERIPEHTTSGGATVSIKSDGIEVAMELIGDTETLLFTLANAMARVLSHNKPDVVTNNQLADCARTVVYEQLIALNEELELGGKQ